MKTNVYFRGFIFGLIGFALFTGVAIDSASAQERGTRIISVNDPKSGDTLHIEAPISSKADFDKDSPSKLFRERDAMRREMIANCAANKVGIFKSVRHSFVPESIGFATAIAIVGQMEANGDPGAIKHWWEQSVTDPLAQVSFGMFMVGNRAAGQFMNHIGWAFDPCTAVKKLKPGAPLLFGETRMQKVFRPITGGMAMSVGLIASSVTHELLADPNLRMCANIFLGRVPQDKMKEAERACEIAHEDWAPGNKMSEYLDDVLANIVFVCFQGYGVEAAKQLIAKGAGGAEGLAQKKMIAGYALKRSGQKLGAAGSGMMMRFGVTQGAKTIVFRGAVAVITVGKFVGSPIVKAGIWIGNMIIFLKGIDYIMPYFEKPLTQYFDGREVTGAINDIMVELNKAEKNGWVWTAPPKPYRCSKEYQAAVKYSTNEFAQVVPQECFKTPKTPGQLIDRLNYKQKKWREFVLRDAYAETSNWQDFVLQFTNTYAASYKTYSYVVSQIANQRFLVDRKVEGARPDYLYWHPEHWGLPIDYANWDGKICHLPKETQDLMAQGRAIIDAELAKSQWSPSYILRPDTFLGMPNVNPNFGWKDWRLFNSPIHLKEPKAFRERMQTIRAGLVAMDCRVPMTVAPDYKSVKEVTPQKLEALRLKRFNRAISTLFSVLTREPQSGYARWTDAGRGIDHPMYPWFSKINPFMKLNMILADPEPYPDGVAFFRMLNDEPTFIDQDRKDDHPRKIGKIATPKMTEYILGNMVCGPEANRPDQVSIVSIPGKAKSMLQRWVGRSWGFKDDYTTATSEKMIDIVRNWKSQFIPPRIIKDPGYDVCQSNPSQGNWMMDAGEMPTNDYKFDPHMNFWTIRGKKYWGFSDIVRNEIRPEVLGQNMNDGTFQKWWAAKVEPHAKKVVADFSKQYRHIIAEKYLPALLKRERTTYQGRSFALGARNSMLDELRLNLEILRRIYNAGRPNSGPEFDAAAPTIINIKESFELGLKMVGTQEELKEALLKEAQTGEKSQGALYYTNPRQAVSYASPVAIESYARNNERMMAQIGALEKMMAQPGAGLSPAAKRNVKEIGEAAVVNLKNLVTELASYNGMLLSLRLEEIPQAQN